MIPIITYHALGDYQSPVFTRPADFEKQLAAFSKGGYQSISLSALISWLDGEGDLPENGVVFTFDDAYETVYTEAWPLMKRYGFKGIIFVISDYCGQTNQWPGQMKGIPERPLMTWQQLAEMAADGWELGAHTRTHPLLPRLSTAEIEDEIISSQAEITRRTGSEARLFAQPYGETNSTVDQVVSQHFDGAVNTVLGLVNERSNPFHLSRIDAYYLRIGLIEKLKGPMTPAYLGLRQMLRRMRRLI